MSVLKDIKIYFNMLFNYKPKKFWNELLSDSFNLRGVGHYRLSEEENLKMYESKKKILSDELKKHNIHIGQKTKMIEIGTGVGFWTDYFHQLGVREYTGNDIAEISVKKLSEKYPGYNFIHGDISEIRLPENTYNLGVMIDVSQHITDDTRFRNAIKNLWDSLVSNSHLIITIWDPSKKVYLANKLRLNRIEKPRGINEYMKIFGNEAVLLSNVDFNDKNLLVIRKI